MKLTDILVRKACIVEMQAKTKKDALQELAVGLARHTSGLDERELLGLLLEREKLGTTGMGDGIAIPHARIESLDRLVANFGRSGSGIEFDSVDGKQAHLFFLMVAPGREGSAHLLTLAKLSRLLSEAQFRARLQELESVDELFRVVEEAESG